MVRPVYLSFVWHTRSLLLVTQERSSFLRRNHWQFTHKRESFKLKTGTEAQRNSRHRGTVGTQEQWAHRNRGTVGTEEQWAHRNRGTEELSVPLCPLFLCAHCSSVLTVPLCPMFLCSSVPNVPLFLCAYCSSVPLCPLFLCAHCSSVPTVPLFLCSSVPTVPLFPCANCYSDDVSQVVVHEPWAENRPFLTARRGLYSQHIGTGVALRFCVLIELQRKPKKNSIACAEFRRLRKKALLNLTRRK